MRCLGRIVSMLVLLILGGAAWLYRDDLIRQVERITDPMAAARAVGAHSPEAARAGQSKLAQLNQPGVDSVLLTPAEFGAILLASLPDAFGAADSITTELGEREVRLAGLINLNRLAPPVASFLKLNPESRERIVLAGGLTPAKAGLAEWDLNRVSIKGIPLPADLVSKLLREAGLKAVDGRIQIVLPRRISSFRIRQSGAVLYSGSSR